MIAARRLTNTFHNDDQKIAWKPRVPAFEESMREELKEGSWKTGRIDFDSTPCEKNTDMTAQSSALWNLIIFASASTKVDVLERARDQLILS